MCPKCRKPQTDSKLLACPTCEELYSEDAQLPAPKLSEEDLDRISARVFKSFKEEDFDSVAGNVLRKFSKGDWKFIANQVWKSLNLVYHGKQLGTLLMGTWHFWIFLGIIVGITAFGAFKLAPDAARNKAVSLFNETVTRFWCANGVGSALPLSAPTGL